MCCDTTDCDREFLEIGEGSERGEVELVERLEVERDKGGSC